MYYALSNETNDTHTIKHTNANNDDTNSNNTAYCYGHLVLLLRSAELLRALLQLQVLLVAQLPLLCCSAYHYYHYYVCYLFKAYVVISCYVLLLILFVYFYRRAASSGIRKWCF